MQPEFLKYTIDKLVHYVQDCKYNHFCILRLKIWLFRKPESDSSDVTNKWLFFILDTPLSNGLALALSFAGKFGISGSFITIFLYTPEVYPTNLRYALET